jgi:hypothetical protein
LKHSKPQHKRNNNALSKAISTILLLPLLASLSACTVTTYGTDNANPYLNKQGEIISLETPIIRFPDSVYNLDLGDYSVKNASVSLGDYTEELLDIRVETKFSNILLPWFGEWNQRLHTYEVSKSQKYSFELYDKGSKLLGAANCIIQNVSVKDLALDEDDIRSEQSSLLKASFLSCTIQDQNTTWTLTFDQSRCQAAQFALQSSGQSKTIDTVSWNRKNRVSAYILSSEGSEQAAVGIKGDPVIWLDSNLIQKDRILLLLSSYSLVLHVWLDGNAAQMAKPSECNHNAMQ